MRPEPFLDDPRLVPRFRTMVDRRTDADCWPWRGCLNACGYGRISLRGKVRSALATHVALHLDGRPRPAGMIALHSCDKPACVNPSHLRWGTRADNTTDMVKRGRNVPGIARGARNGNSKLTEEAVLAIRASRETQAILAERYGVSSDTIHEVRTGKKWKHLPGAIHLKPRRARNGGIDDQPRSKAA